ncbi:hypothetical protein PWG14_20030 (plasmid) [Chromobacterium amazonense]|nr:hypothetical protein [Chromobacterium amazonense]MDE1714786.1 hypothetical protein [Chromobacterium amazonense]
MKERPILFAGEMVRPVLAGTKTQTRRVMSDRVMKSMRAAASMGEITWFMDEGQLGENDLPYIVDFCPYGRPGDRLWVRETFQIMRRGDDWDIPIYRADDIAGHINVAWKPSIHMPRWASRILLEITEVRVERLQDISEADAVAEGVTPAAVQSFADTGLVTRPAGFAYRDLWEQINGTGSWDANPWVWVVEFKRVEE